MFCLNGKLIDDGQPNFEVYWEEYGKAWLNFTKYVTVA